MTDVMARAAQALADTLERKDLATMYFAGMAADANAEAERMRTVVLAAEGFVDWHLRGQPGIPNTLYPFTYAQQDAWHDELDTRLAALVEAVAAFGSEAATCGASSGVHQECQTEVNRLRRERQDVLDQLAKLKVALLESSEGVDALLRQIREAYP